MTKAQLFLTCLGDQLYTSTLQNMTRILERLGVELIFPPEQTCCGQPLLNNGFEDKMRPVTLNFMHAFARSDAPIVGPSGSCANVCPVYKKVGGFAYGWFISGPIGAILSPHMLGTKTARELPFASTLCGARGDVCPVKIPIPTILCHLRRRVSQGDAVALPTMPAPIRATANLTSLALAQNWIYRLGARVLPIINPFFRKDNWLANMPYPINRWTRVRPLPLFHANFRSCWKNVRSYKGKESTQ